MHSLIDQTLKWSIEHKNKERELEFEICQYRVKILERCVYKKTKPDFILKTAYKIKIELLIAKGLADKRFVKPAIEVYLDNCFINRIALQAIKDFCLYEKLPWDSEILK